MNQDVEGGGGGLKFCVCALACVQTSEQRKYEMSAMSARRQRVLRSVEKSVRLLSEVWHESRPAAPD